MSYCLLLDSRPFRVVSLFLLAVICSLSKSFAKSESALVFIDPMIEDVQLLIDSVQPGASVFLFESGQDPLEQITSALREVATSTGDPIDSVHIVSHGAPGALAIGQEWVTTHSLQESQSELGQWDPFLAPDSDLLLYGCRVGADREFLSALSSATGTDVAASNDLTGASSLNGDWDLEISTGAIRSSTAFTSEVLAFAHTLVAPTVKGLTDRGATEDTTGSPDFSGVIIADVDTFGNIVVTITAGDTGAVLGAVDGSGVGAGVTETASGNNVVTLVGTAADITTYLGNASAITYTSSQDRETDDTISIQADDGISVPNAASTATIVMTPVNDPPTISGLPTDISFFENTTGYFDISASTLYDVDSSFLTFTLTASEGSFGPLADGAGVGAGVAETLVNLQTVSLAGSFPDINTYLDTAFNVQYTGALNDIGDDTATVAVEANDGEGSGNVLLGIVNIDIIPGTSVINPVPDSANTAWLLLLALFGLSRLSKFQARRA